MKTRDISRSSTNLWCVVCACAGVLEALKQGKRGCVCIRVMRGPRLNSGVSQSFIYQLKVADVRCGALNVREKCRIPAVAGGTGRRRSVLRVSLSIAWFRVRKNKKKNCCGVVCRERESWFFLLLSFISSPLGDRRQVNSSETR